MREPEEQVSVSSKSDERAGLTRWTPSPSSQKSRPSPGRSTEVSMAMGVAAIGPSLRIALASAPRSCGMW